ncbi:hypothetical protein ACWGDE_08630 [Streptomyces sp. NPDC054956]
MTALLRLYPAAYRREFGDEIADAYHRATEGTDRPARMREASDVIGHALRMRLGLGSSGRAGRFLAALAPFAVVALGVHAVIWSRLTAPALRVGHLIDEVGPTVLTGAASIVTLVGAVLALTGRWTMGAWTVLAGTGSIFASQAMRLGFGIEFAVVTSGPFLLMALVAVLCPPDLRPVLRRRTATGVAATLAGAAALTAAPVALPLPYGVGGLCTAVAMAGGLVPAGRQAFARLRTAPAALLAGLPFVQLSMFTGMVNWLFLPAVLGLLLAASAVVSVRRRRGGSTPAV